jgi:putative ABC transport system substrate-binding protein
MIRLRTFLLLLSAPVFFVLIVVFIIALSATRPPATDVYDIEILTWKSNEGYVRTIEAFKQELAELGFVEGVNVRYRLLDANATASLQKELVNGSLSSPPDLIFSLTTPGTLIVKETSKATPIVFSNVGFPVESGLVQSLENPGGRVTGTRNWVKAQDQLRAFSQLMPEMSRIGFIHHAGDQDSSPQFQEFKAVGLTRGIEVDEIPVADEAELSKTMAALPGNLDALYVACDTLMQDGGAEIVIKASSVTHKPLFSCFVQGVNRGASMGIVADDAALGIAAGQKAAKILSGSRAGGVPVTGVLPKILLNSYAIAASGLEAPQSLLLLSSQVTTTPP